MLQVQVTGTDAMRAKLQRVGDALPKQALASTAVEVEGYVEREAGKHNKTGALVRSIYKTPVPGGWEIGHDLQHAKHALFFHTGTGLHGPKAQKFEIRAKNKRALHYAKDGVFWFWFGPKSPQEQAVIRKWVREKSGASSRVMFRWPKNPGMKKDAWMERAAAIAPKLFQQHVETLLNKA